MKNIQSFEIFNMNEKKEFEIENNMFAVIHSQNTLFHNRYTKKEVERVKKFFQREKIFKQLSTMVSYLIPHRSDVKLKLNVGGGSFTDGDTITIGLPDIFIGRSEGEIFTALRALIGHESQHVNSSDFEAFKEFIQNATYYFMKKYPALNNFISKKYLEKVAHHFGNSVEDGRIEKITPQKFPGFAKYYKFLNMTLWNAQPIQGNSELEDFLYSVTSYCVTGLFPKDFKKFYQGTEVEGNLNRIKPMILKGIDARTCQDCLKQTFEIMQAVEPFLVKHLTDRTRETETFLNNMDTTPEFTTSEEKEHNNNPSSVNTHFIPKKSKPQKQKEENKEEDQDQQPNGQTGEGEDDQKDQEESKSTEKKDEQPSGGSGSKSDEKENEENTGENQEESSGDGSSKEEEESEENEEGTGGSSDQSSDEEERDESQETSTGSGDENSDEEGEDSENSNGEDDENREDESNHDEEDQTDGEGSVNDTDDSSDNNSTDDYSSDGNVSDEDSSSKESDQSQKDQEDEEDYQANSNPSGMEDRSEDEVDEEEIASFIEQLTKEVEEEANRRIEPSKERVNKQKLKEEDFRLNEEELAEIEKKYKNDINKRFEEVRNLKLRYPLPADIKREGVRFRREIERIFRNKQAYTLKGQRKGILDTGNLHKLLTKDYNVFTKKGVPVENDYVAYLLEDGSGSMSEYGKWIQSKRALAIMEEGLKGIIPFKISTFCTDLYGNSVIHQVVKDFHEENKSYNYAYNAFMQRRPNGGNKDGYSIRVATKELLKRPEKDKILIIFSDGLPSNYRGGKNEGMVDVKEAIKEARKAGIFVVSLLFGTEEFRDMNIENYRYMYEKNIISCEPQMIANQLTRMLKKIISH